jgi:glucose-6-phosphate dehydrogenase assembly protein OpcA
VEIDLMTMIQDPIQLTDINTALSRLWDREQGQKKMRASLFNLILYVQKNERVSFYQSLIKSVVSKFPCRVMLILCDDQSKEEYLRTSVSSETVGEKELQIFCEIIQVEVAGKLIERVPFIILPHILPDLPVNLLWTQDPSTENSVLPHLEPVANRIIFDPESMPDLQNYSRTVLSLMHRFHCEIGDLNWSALSGWRTIFVQVFNTPEALLSLLQSTLIRVHYKSENSSQKHAETEAIYLQGWLASRLNWKFESLEVDKGNIRVTYRRPVKEVTILLIPQESNQVGAFGTILEVELESAKDKGHYCLKRHPETRQVFIQYANKDLCFLPYTSYLSGPAQGQELIEEILYPSDRKHYREMLETLALIPWSAP